MNRQLFLFVALLTVSPAALAQPTRETLDALHQNYANALVRKDFVAIERFYSDHISRDFKWNKSGGPVMTFIDMWEGNRQDMANLAKGLSDGPIIFQMKLKSWKLRGDVARIVVETVGNGEWYKDGGWVPVSFQVTVEETWRFENGKWLAIKFRDLKVDGKFGKPQAKSRWKAK